MLIADTLPSERRRPTRAPTLRGRGRAALVLSMGLLAAGIVALYPRKGSDKGSPGLDRPGPPALEGATAGSTATSLQGSEPVGERFVLGAGEPAEPRPSPSHSPAEGSEETPRPQAPAELVDLLDRLEETEGRIHGNAFFREAQPVAEELAALLGPLGPATDPVLEERLGRPDAAERFRGAVLWCMGSSGVERLRPAVRRAAIEEAVSEARCGAVLGLARWSGEGRTGYRFSDYYPFSEATGGPPGFEVVLDRATLDPALVEPLLALSADEGAEPWLRQVVVLVLGQALDGDPRVLHACFERLESPEWRGDPTLPAWLFVASHSEREDVQERLLGLAEALLSRPDQADETLRLLFALLERRASPRLLDLVLRAIADPEGSRLHRGRLLVGLDKALRRGVVLPPAMLQSIEEVLAHVGSEPGWEVERLVALYSLVQIAPERATRLLEEVLLFDPDPGMRASVARAVAESLEEPAALAVLESALSSERDPQARISVVRALGRLLPSEAARQTLQRALPGAEPDLAQLIRELLGGDRGG